MNRILVFLTFFAGCGLAQSAWCQGTGNTGNQVPTTPTTGTPAVGTQTTTAGGDGGGNVSGLNNEFNLGDLINLGQDFSQESMFENDRIQPFVGPSAQNVVHPRSQIDPAGSTLGSAGGAGLTSSRSGLGQNRSQSGPLGSTGLAGTNQQGFTVPRRGVRGAVLYTPVGRSAGSGMVSGFAARLSRLPSFASISSIEVRVEDRIAILTGVVDTAEQKDLIGRQAALEPGVSGVINDLRVGQ